MVQSTGERLHKRLSDGKYVKIEYTRIALNMPGISIPPNTWYTWDGQKYAVIAESTLETGYAPAGWGKQHG